ncbi:hypothetical protein R1CP_37395 (plasmid) [Rhodococcus opacus]|uniref:Uncharacterized protein n=1 Tax=Rhodococcus opacus TaxID=37919 RepID=A0A1B1KHI3_RHOOP|nr:hypothetical protein R1CP_37395 [Rhodococcus opacus]
MDGSYDCAPAESRSGILLSMPRYLVTLDDGTSSEKTFESDFHAINETHRPHPPRRGIAQIDRYDKDGTRFPVWPSSTTKSS